MGRLGIKPGFLSAVVADAQKPLRVARQIGDFAPSVSRIGIDIGNTSATEPSVATTNRRSSVQDVANQDAKLQTSQAPKTLSVDNKSAAHVTHAESRNETTDGNLDIEDQSLRIQAESDSKQAFATQDESDGPNALISARKPAPAEQGAASKIETSKPVTGKFGDIKMQSSLSGAESSTPSQNRALKKSKHTTSIDVSAQSQNDKAAPSKTIDPVSENNENGTVFKRGKIGTKQHVSKRPAQSRDNTVKTVATIEKKSTDISRITESPNTTGHQAASPRNPRTALHQPRAARPAGPKVYIGRVDVTVNAAPPLPAQTPPALPTSKPVNRQANLHYLKRF